MQPSPQISYVYASDGKTLIATFYDENRHDVPLNDIAPIMQQAIIAAEDQRFYQHHGVDIKGVARAFVANQSAGDDQQGASTLTMQYVRQALAYSATNPAEVVAATEDTSARKLREMQLRAAAREGARPRTQILERYLNIASFGNGAYGIYAASQVYFGKEPKDLTLERGGAAGRPGQGAHRVRPDRPTGRQAAGAGAAQLRDRPTWCRSGTITQAAGRPPPRQAELKVTGKRTPERLRRDQQAQLGLLLRLLLPLVDAAAGVRRRPRTTGSGGSRAAATRIVTTLDVQGQAGGQATTSSKQLKTGKQGRR